MDSTESETRINVGCGATPTPGWLNLDNSASVVLSRLPDALISILSTLRLLTQMQADYARKLRSLGVRRASAEQLPLASDSAEVIYSSHMLEHLDRREASLVLAEFWRILRPGGTLRLALPDLRRRAVAYLATGNADQFVESTSLAAAKPRTTWDRIRLVLIGPRHHHWMYDAESMIRVLCEHGFVGAAELAPGETTIGDPGELNLREREEESFYVEARKPARTITRHGEA